MKLVLLPGMDGTGLLFRDVLAHLTWLECEVIPLPHTGPQDIDSLARHVATRLPQSDYVVLAESFSGKIAETLLLREDPNLKAVIFVASFLSRPGRLLPGLAAALPVKALLALPASSLAIRWFLMGRQASDETIARFRQAVISVPQKVLGQRLRQIAGMRFERRRFTLPALYLRPRNDVLVNNATAQFRESFANLDVVEIGGPHFILQARPERCADIIVEAVREWFPACG
ncbi:hypothetical protein MA04_02389 [Alcanivorax balearicus MACL04]|uniref:AB hydrolase-1 domain-containing protein n=1 Tax=Alloalcanivorax balearicus MACL04 TaxID=1177182 RepID=A0ABT2QZY6_9GAMM|nr:alpha/beta fold hydrolase [Alloalcanivorax balearicus]MCU5783089.1 hypothetical protein [Alloalcanivorax balearicus MACL04]